MNSNTGTDDSSDSDSSNNSDGSTGSGSDGGNQWSDRDNSFQNYRSLFINRQTVPIPKSQNGSDFDALLASIDIASELAVDPEIRFNLRRSPRFVLGCLCLR